VALLRKLAEQLPEANDIRAKNDDEQDDVLGIHVRRIEASKRAQEEQSEAVVTA